MISVLAGALYGCQTKINKEKTLRNRQFKIIILRKLRQYFNHNIKLLALDHIKEALF
jgi:hypothetical protein